MAMRRLEARRYDCGAKRFSGPSTINDQPSTHGDGDSDAAAGSTPLRLWSEAILWAPSTISDQPSTRAKRFSGPSTISDQPSTQVGQLRSSRSW
jgi:hypothetical protein